MEATMRRTICTMPRREASPRARRKKRRAHRTRALLLWIALLALCACIVRAAQLGDWLLAGLPVDTVYQNPQLPNGCEAASLAAVLNYNGIPADKMDLAYGYIPRVEFDESGPARTGADPETAYPGDPATSRGFYCFAAPLCAGANELLAERGSALRAVDVTGVTEAGLRAYLEQGDPVIVWTTLDFSPPRTSGSFTWVDSATGETIAPFVNLHCLVLTGMGESMCVLADPLEGERRADLDNFLRSFDEVGRRAVVIH